MDKKQILRKIPKVDDVLFMLSESDGLQTPAHVIETQAVREVLAQIREDVLSGKIEDIPSEDDILSSVQSSIHDKVQMNLRPVINATGIILHTNLGRARLGEKTMQSVVQAAQNYSTLEYDIDLGARGHRNTLVEELITELTGAESALVVNNNAAAVMLILSTMCNEKEVVISRGELVEIGGSFRIPSIMNQSGSILVEVGTTNKTKLRDYEDAIKGGETAALLKVHTSNFKITGFSEAPELKELSALAKKHNLPLIYDIGSGALTDLQKYGIYGEPTVPQCIKDGADVVCFSGDKLLGGSQAGIIAGKKEYIEAMKKNQLARALRIDKMTMAALEATFRHYIDGTEKQNIPTLAMLAVSAEELKEKAEILCKKIKDKTSNCSAEAVEEFSQVGGGSVPGQMLATYAVAVKPDEVTVAELERRIRAKDVPIIGRISKDRLLFDVRTLDEADFEYIASSIAESLN